MSQRARAHTTGATRNTTEPTLAAPATSPTASVPADAAGSAPAAPTGVTDTPREPSVSTDPTVTVTDAANATGVGVQPLARALRAMATELERDPALARRVADAMQAPGQRARSEPPTAAPTVPHSAADERTSEQTSEATAASEGGSRVNCAFHPRIVTGTPPELGAGVPDPFALAERLGVAGLRAALADLRLGSLRAIVREHRLDPESRLVGVNDAAKFRAVILGAVRAAEPAPKRTNTIDTRRPKQV